MDKTLLGQVEQEGEEPRLLMLASFFPSRRRHTRFDCDWSSDVCSSDLDLGRRGDLGDRLGDLPLLVLRQDLVAEGDALITNVDRRAGNELPDRVLRLAAEGAAEVLIVGHLALVWESRVTGASRHFFFPSSISWKLAMTWSISPYSLASSADMKRSRSMSFSMCSTALPVCLAYSSLSLPRRYRI